MASATIHHRELPERKAFAGAVNSFGFYGNALAAARLRWAGWRLCKINFRISGRG
jgi:hypothetical protein